MKNTLKLALTLVVLIATSPACSSEKRREGSERTALIHIQTELETLPVAPGEVVIGDRQAPVDIQSPCIVPVVQGIGRYADVGFVAPRFFTVPSANGQSEGI